MLSVERVLIANRGEIAIRVIRACRELNISPVAIFSPGEEQALHVKMADDAYALPNDDGIPYLNQRAILEIAARARVQAIHPGYGFLAENANFASACRSASFLFVGPPSSAIDSMGDKIRARQIAISAGVPVVPGSDGAIDSVEKAQRWADENGYPAAVKASAGGGGRGFRVARSAAELAEAYAGSSGEAERYFSDGTVYLERYLENPRHIEVQIFCDQHGSAVWLGERDCSIQRRHQKLVEETPSPAVGDALRARLGEASLALARKVGYENAGTVEFMVTPAGEFFFLEMNTRIQVEHTITEEVTGIDLVKEQFRVAAGERLSFSQSDIYARGASIQCRINAEDAGANFNPMPGNITAVRLPEGPGIRVDTAVQVGSEIDPRFDSLIAKLIVWGRDRPEAIARMRRALNEFDIAGVPSTIPFHQNVMNNETFVAGDATTTFLLESPEVLPEAYDGDWAPAAEMAPMTSVQLQVNGRLFTVKLPADLAVGQRKAAQRSQLLKPSDRPGLRTANAQSGNEIRSPIQGTVVRTGVKIGDWVEPDALICVVEAMKMENEVTASQSGSVKEIPVRVGDSVQVGSLLAILEDARTTD